MDKLSLKLAALKNLVKTSSKNLSEAERLKCSQVLNSFGYDNFITNNSFKKEQMDFFLTASPKEFFYVFSELLIRVWNTVEFLEFISIIFSTPIVNSAGLNGSIDKIEYQIYHYCTNKQFILAVRYHNQFIKMMNSSIFVFFPDLFLRIFASESDTDKILFSVASKIDLLEKLFDNKNLKECHDYTFKSITNEIISLIKTTNVEKNELLRSNYAHSLSIILDFFEKNNLIPSKSFDYTKDEVLNSFEKNVKVDVLEKLQKEYRSNKSSDNLVLFNFSKINNSSKIFNYIDSLENEGLVICGRINNLKNDNDLFEKQLHSVLLETSKYLQKNIVTESLQIIL